MAHLLRRAGFGATYQEFEAALADGYESTVERLLHPDGRYAWQSSRQEIENEEEFKSFLERRRKSDPDLWILELDIACAERFAAEMNESG